MKEEVLRGTKRVTGVVQGSNRDWSQVEKRRGGRRCSKGI